MFERIFFSYSTYITGEIYNTYIWLLWQYPCDEYPYNTHLCPWIIDPLSSPLGKCEDAHDPWRMRRLQREIRVGRRITRAIKGAKRTASP